MHIENWLIMATAVRVYISGNSGNKEVRKSEFYLYSDPSLNKSLSKTSFGQFDNSKVYFQILNYFRW